jgi:hypothetical protein
LLNYYFKNTILRFFWQIVTVFSIEVAIDEVGNLNYLLVGFDTKKAQTSKAVGVTFLFGAI